MFAYLFAHEAGKLVVDRVAGTCGDDAAFDRFADESHVTDDVKQLMARALVVPLQRAVLDIAYLRGIDMRYVKEVSELVELGLLNLLLVDDDGIVEVAAFDEVGLQQRDDVADKDEGAGRSNVSSVIVDAVEGGKL